jgi:hypothetical protein
VRSNAKPISTLINARLSTNQADNVGVEICCKTRSTVRVK